MTNEPQRRAPRIPKGFIVRFRAVGEPSAGWCVSPLRDLSQGGARFLSEQTFAVGTALETLLVLPASQQPVPLSARVAWAKPPAMGLAELGITFDVAPGDTASQQAIAAAVKRFLERSTPRG